MAWWPGLTPGHHQTGRRARPLWGWSRGCWNRAGSGLCRPSGDVARLPWAAAASAWTERRRATPRHYSLCLIATATLPVLPPIGSSHAPTSRLCAGRNESGQVALRLLVRGDRATRLAQTLALHRRHHEVWGPAPHSGITIRRARATRGPRAAPSRNDCGCLGDEAVLVQSKEPPDGSRARSSRSPGPSPARKWGRTASSARWS